MNFRQRMSWLLVLFFLALSALLSYYIFEFSDQYNDLALEHVQAYSDTVKNNPHLLTFYQKITRYLVTLPFWLWLVILMIPYLQVFCLLVACTKSDPMKASIVMVPMCLCLKLSSILSKSSGGSSRTDILIHTEASKLPDETWSDTSWMCIVIVSPLTVLFCINRWIMNIPDCDGCNDQLHHQGIFQLWKVVNI